MFKGMIYGNTLSTSIPSSNSTVFNWFFLPFSRAKSALWFIIAILEVLNRSYIIKKLAYSKPRSNPEAVYLLYGYK